VGFNGLELDLQQKSAVAGYLLHFVYFGLLCGELRLEVRANPKKLLGFLPFFGILVSTVFAFALHDPLGKVEILSVDLKLDEWQLYFAKIGGNVIEFGLRDLMLPPLLEEGLRPAHNILDRARVKCCS
jgi:hypothetical protein